MQTFRSNYSVIGEGFEKGLAKILNRSSPSKY